MTILNNKRHGITSNLQTQINGKEYDVTIYHWKILSLNV